MSLITLLIVDDQNLMRDGLQTILNLQDDMKVVGTAKDGVEALQLVSLLSPQVVLMDIKMPVMDGIECTKRIKALSKETIVLILTTFAHEDYIIEALAGGATGFLLKDMPADNLAQAIRDAVNGQFLLPSAIAIKLAKRLNEVNKSTQTLMTTARVKMENVNLTDKEIEVARFMVLGSSNRSMAEKLFISEGTIKNYISSIYSKIGTNDRTLAILTLKMLLDEDALEVQE